MALVPPHLHMSLLLCEFVYTNYTCHNQCCGEQSPSDSADIAFGKPLKRLVNLGKKERGGTTQITTQNVVNLVNFYKVNRQYKYVAEHKSGEGGHLYFEQGKLTN